jgi:hypothetical protein
MRRESEKILPLVGDDIAFFEAVNDLPRIESLDSASDNRRSLRGCHWRYDFHIEVVQPFDETIG